MNENDFTEAITANLPEKPSTTGWGPQVRRRRRRQRATTGAVALVAVAALAVPLALQLGGRGQTVQTTPSPTTQAVDEPVRPIPALINPEGSGCRTSQGEPEQRTALTGGKLEPGVTKIWLCGRDEVGDDQLPRIGPFEPLTEGVDKAVSQFNSFEWMAGAAIDCNSDGRAFDVVFEYADGAKRVVRGYDTRGGAGCSHFASADGVGGDAPSYLAALADLWAAQRQSAPPLTDDLAVCPGSDSLFSVDTSTLIRGYACRASEQWNQRPIPADLAKAIIDGVGAAKPLPQEPLAGGKERLVLVSAHGDPFVVYWQGREFAWNADGYTVWTPTAELAERINELFVVSPSSSSPTATGATHTAPVATLSPAPTPQDVSCDKLDSLRDAGLYEGRLPEGAVSAVLCAVPLEGMDAPTAPKEPLTTNVDRIVADFNALPDVWQTCPADAGPEYVIVLTYGDHQVRVIRVETAGCRTVSSGGKSRGGGEDFLRKVKGYWLE